ncbi:uncharacterized protein LOC113239427 [Hyposmocoma kahamanoa]|uniref:uncharacterized protein LOC113239427 n=1 Tax=Hyposmocoma kahamanoa TaxID=1477025 RepID=UPI000E6D9A08|nr:uncharacterized protein LOC113239427 [Hyposmocoma kahamanoa]
MYKYLKPDRLEIDSTSNVSYQQQWLHWRKTFENFLQESRPTTESGQMDHSDSVKLKLLINYVSLTIYKMIASCKTYLCAISTLESIYVKPKSIIFARHKLTTRTQQLDESIDQYVQDLKLLAKDCDFKAVTAQENESDSIRGAFIAGLRSPQIRQRLLENLTLTLDEARNKARALEFAEIQSCGKRGHFAKSCRSQTLASIANAEEGDSISSSLFVATVGLNRCVIPIKLNGINVKALIDTGSTASFVDEKVVQRYNIPTPSWKQNVSMASQVLKSQITSACYAPIQLNGSVYPNTLLRVMENLCSDVIIGHDIMAQCSSLEIKFDGPKPFLTISALKEANIEPVNLFPHLSPNCTPIAVKSRRHASDNLVFIESEIHSLLSEGIIEESTSPWRAQTLVTFGTHQKKRMCIDYSQTINKFTYLDAYPLPNMEDVVAKVAKWKVFSKIDLKSAYHQIPILDSNKQFTAFEACGNLYQFTRIPFGVTNGVACFQRSIDTIIRKTNLSGVYPYLDDITICDDDDYRCDKQFKRCSWTFLLKEDKLEELLMEYGRIFQRRVKWRGKESDMKPELNRSVESERESMDGRRRNL